MPQYKVVIHSNEQAEEEVGMPIQFFANDKKISFIPGKELIISETALENLRDRAVREKFLIKDGQITDEKILIQRYPVTVIEIIYSEDEKEEMIMKSLREEELKKKEENRKVNYLNTGTAI
jgi:hypothetical protein